MKQELRIKNGVKTALRMLLVSYFLLLPSLTSATINFNGKEYGFHSTTTETILNQIPDIKLNSSTLSSDALGKLVGSASKAASTSSGWLKNSAGIDIKGIIKTIGGAFVVVIRFMSNLISAGIQKL